MRALFVIVLIIAAVFLGGWWLTGRHHARDYAPSEAQDTELQSQPAPEPTAPASAPTDFKTGSAANLPTGPIPYDQLNKQTDPTLATDPNAAPPEKKSNDKAIFY
ncbi:MAG TPA: hypothetical protein VGL66_08790 [Caulobacteraceae bacterium]|jgi:hypothetical protein